VAELSLTEAIEHPIKRNVVGKDPWNFQMMMCPEMAERLAHHLLVSK